jgi:ERF superfamily
MELAKSEQLNELATALAKAEAEFEQVEKDTINPHFGKKYADLATLIRATRPYLAKHGISVVQVPRLRAQNFVEVTTMILHTSGQFMACELVMPAAQRDRFDAQTIGSAITYARRYAYQSMLNVAGEEDDDGNAAAGRNGNVAKADKSNGHDTDSSTPQHFEPSTNGRIINATQARAFWSAVKQGGKTEAQVLNYFTSIGIVRTEGMRKTDFDKAMKWAMAADEEVA